MVVCKADKYYLDNLRKIVSEGRLDKNPRPVYKDGKKAHSHFITSVFEEYDLTKNEMPIPTLRKTAIKTGIREILWIYQRQSNSLAVAHEMGIKWWDEWDIGDGTIGHRYGWTVREHDLMNRLLDGLAKDPFGRRHIMNLWQESDIRSSDGLPPCAFMTEWSAYEDGGVFFLDCHLSQRSNDYIMAGYINKAQYVALMMMVAAHLEFVTGNEWQVGKFTHHVQNLHIYDRHISAMLEIIRTTPAKMPVLPNGFETKLTSFSYDGGPKNFYDITIEDFGVFGQEQIPKLESELEIAI